MLGAAVVAGLALWLVAAPQYLLEYLFKVLPAIDQGTGFFENHSPGGTITRLFDPTTFLGPTRGSPLPARIITIAIAIAVLGVTFWVLGRPSRDRSGRALEAAAAGSELAKLRGETIAGPLPGLDGIAAAEAHERVRLLVNSGALTSSHDVSEGGLAVAIAESCIAGEIGARVTLPAGLDPFAEAPGRAFVVSGPEAALTGLPIIGRVGGDELKIDGLVDIAVSVMRDTRARGLSQYL